MDLNNNDIELINQAMIMVEAMRLTDAEVNFLNLIDCKGTEALTQEHAAKCARKVLVKRVKQNGSAIGSLYAMDEIAKAKGWDLGGESAGKVKEERRQGFLHIHAGGLI